MDNLTSPIDLIATWLCALRSDLDCLAETHSDPTNFGNRASNSSRRLLTFLCSLCHSRESENPLESDEKSLDSRFRGNLKIGRL